MSPTWTLIDVCNSLDHRVNDAQSRPKRQYTPKPRPVFDYGEVEQSNGGYSPAASSPPAYSAGILVYAVTAMCVCFFERPTPKKACVWAILILKHVASFFLQNKQHKVRVHHSKEPPSRADPVS